MSNNEKQVTEKNVSLKEIRDTFYHLRDFEIKNLWQRSIFLSFLIVLSFTAYGKMVIELFANKNILIKNEICSVLALFGMTLSIIWIMMAKGSKAWYEVYEKRICDIEKERELEIPEKYRMGADCSPWKLDSNLFTGTAGKYSVSKLNIFIGQLLMFVWVIVFIIHIIGVFIYMSCDICYECFFHGVIVGFLIIIFIIIIISALLNKWAKSDALEKGEK